MTTVVPGILSGGAGGPLGPIVGYQVFKDGTPLSPTTTQTQYDISGLSASTPYSFQVLGFDANGNTTPLSGAIQVTTPANSAPVWAAIPTQILTVNSAYSLNLSSFASDADQDALTFSKVSGSFPSGITLGVSSISGVPTTFGEATSAVMRVSDGTVTANVTINFQTFTNDVTAPPVPTGLAVNPVSSSELDLTWNASVDVAGSGNELVTGTAGYKVYRDGSFRTQVAGTSFADTGLVALSTHSYRVSAVDAAANESTQCTAVPGTTQSTGVQQFDYFISPTGSDSNDGLTPTASGGHGPWAITAINTKQATYSGKKVGLVQGTYNIQALAAASGSGNNGYQVVTLQVNGGASSSSPTYIASCDASGNYVPPNAAAANGSKCAAIITCKVGSTYGNPNNNNTGTSARAGNPMMGFWAFGGLPANPKNVTLDGIGFTGNVSGNVTFGSAGESPAVPGIVVKNCEFFDNNGLGSEVGDNLCFMSLTTSGALIQNNYFHDAVNNTSTGALDHLSAVLFWHPSANNICEFNTCTNCGVIFPKSQAISNPDIEGTILRYNYIDTSMFTSGDGAGLYDGADNRTTLCSYYGNIGIGWQPCKVVRVEGGATSGPVEIYNNTFIITNTAGADRQGMYTANSGTGTLKQYNNVVVNNTGGSINEGYASLTKASIAVCDYNLYLGGANQWSTNSAQGSFAFSSSLAAWQTAIAADAHSNIGTAASVAFASSGTFGARYKLNAGSVALGFGRVGGLSSGAVVDAGAFGVTTRVGCDFA